MICKKCNSEINDGVRFCPYCGEKIFETTGGTEVLSENATEVPVCEEVSIESEEQYVIDLANVEYNADVNDNQTTVLTAEESSSDIEYGTSVLVAEPQIEQIGCFEKNETDAYIPKINIGDLAQKIDEKQKPKNRLLKKVLLSVVAIIIAMSVSVVGFVFFADKKEVKNDKPVVFVTDDNELYVIETLGKKESDPFFVTDEYCVYESYYFREDGKYILYCTGEEDSMKLEIREVGNDKATAVVLAKNISSVAAVSEDFETIIYEKNENVYFVNQKGESETLIKDAYVDNVSLEMDSLICANYDFETNEETLYYIDLKTKKTIELYSDEITYKCDDNNEYVYILDDNTLYKINKNAEKEKIAKDVCDFELVGSKLYYTTLAESYTYDKFVNDPFKEKDANIVEPDWDDYEPDKENFKKEEEGFFGTYTTIDYDAYENAYSVAEERYEVDYENYTEAENRNEVRSILKANEISTYNLFSYESSKSEMIYSELSSPFISCIHDIDNGNGFSVNGRIYDTPVREVKKVDINVFVTEYSYDAEDCYALIFDKLKEETIIINGNSSVVLDLSDGETLDGVWYDKNISAYIIGVLAEKNDDSIDEICTLYSLSEKATSFESAEVIAEDVFAVMYYDYEYVTFTDFSEKNQTLTMNTAKGTIDDVDSFGVIAFPSEKGAFYYSTDKSDNGEATIWKYSKGESTKIAEDILFTSFREYNGKYLGLTDVEYSDSVFSGDLICVNGDETYTIESNVVFVEAGNPEWYSPILISPHYYEAYDAEYDEYY